MNLIIIKHILDILFMFCVIMFMLSQTKINKHQNRINNITI